MRYSILIVVVIVLCMLASPAHAWPEPKEYPRVRLIVGNSETGWSCGIYSGGRWPSYATDWAKIGSDTPPQLNSAQAFRWRVATPPTRATLAERYEVPRDIAEKYGARYLDIGKPWVIGYGLEYGL